MSKSSINRRAFLAGTAATGAALSLPANSYARVLTANDKVRIGFLGTGFGFLAGIGFDVFQASL